MPLRWNTGNSLSEYLVVCVVVSSLLKRSGGSRLLSAADLSYSTLPFPRHGYLTHVILNAGTAAFTGIDWPLAIWMCCTNLHRAVTYPKYKTQRSGDVGEDGYGWVWQANCGAHFILVSGRVKNIEISPISLVKI